jgi:hypothetical protein
MEINKPKKTTYFICRNEKMQIKAYGVVKPNQVMTTTKVNVKTYIREQLWLNELSNNGIDIIN